MHSYHLRIRVGSHSRGFTLVEMLVAVGLVMLMMAMFAEVFSIATKSMSKQRGIAENDQKARMLNVLIRGDLQSMSYRELPTEKGIRALDSVDVNGTVKGKVIALGGTTAMNGYFFIAENNPTDQTDDVLQFTVDMQYAPLELDGSIPQIFGRALQLGGNTTQQADGYPLDALGHNPDQPVFDDEAGRYVSGANLTPASALVSDQTGSSQYAEISYFLRNGNLYRRQMLIRQPIDQTKTDSQPLRPDKSLLLPTGTAYSANELFYNNGYFPIANPGPPPALTQTDWWKSSGTFWGDFDFSAVWNGNPTTGYPQLIGVTTPSSALDNFTSGNGMSVGLPQNRFGFLPSFGAMPFTSRAITHTSDNNFIGRFTQLETSDANFGWPGVPGWGNDGTPYNGDDTNPLTSTTCTSPNGVAVVNGVQFNGPRVSQDVLLQNVHEFNVRVWDPGAVNPITSLKGNFVDLGSGGGFFSSANSTMAIGYGSGAAATPAANLFTNVYDTWTTDTTNAGGGAPFRFPGSNHGPDGKPGVAGVDDDSINGVDDAGETGWPGSDDLLYLRAIQIHIRYYDVSSDSTRDVTIMHAFVK